ncbi:hypothetical protein BCR33DRAFT_713696 [Rhizoclosmatium globosum]|uniref:Glycosyl transferase 64 domain-containing protein n=1 Tax=Rhizoclosmatium globosum TaxID=329046 RepID=A0A1Y2CR71_9FUNG|nr:hypothetical protein BCR33DRAFT_713696 [Rhizoclosmatium globosum]|eukprot:ORY49334.1 hypothetical protein BCR33DRAFT_713696 [Rhizoclosmatium globosum]
MVVRTSQHYQGESKECNCSIKEPKLPWQYICIIGNAQYETDAIRSHKMWNNAFPSFWHVWGTPSSIEPNDIPPNIQFIKSNTSKTWAEGIDILLTIAQYTYDCEYIFTHDDDLDFSLRNASDTRQLDEMLVDLLLEYQPAVAGFPWTFGDQTYAGMKSQAPFQGDDVNVLTGFDSGMILYHKSIVSFFIPYSPRGEGGFIGQWSHAIRLNAIQYKNLVSISNVPVKQRNSKKNLAGGLVLDSASRHPYEYKMNKPYLQFLSTGLLNPAQRFGRELMQMDITWSAEKVKERTSLEEIALNQKMHRSFNRWDFYDLSHPILANNTWIRSHFTDSDIDDFMAMRDELGMDFRFTIHLFTSLQNMPAFMNLWTSLSKAEQISNPISIHIHIDNREQMPASEFISNLRDIRALKSPHGPVVISVNTWRKGPIQTFMNAWFPHSTKEYGIFLPHENCTVSPNFLQYSKRITSYYSKHSSAAIHGFSLHNIGTDASKNRPWTPNVKHELFVLQHPPSFGFVANPNQWVEFVTWFHGLPHDFEPMVYDSAVNQLDVNERWDKFLGRYLVEFGKALCILGESSKMTDTIKLDTIVPVTDLEVYNYQFEKVKKVSSLNYGKRVRPLDKCTLLMFVRDRSRITWRRIEHYQNHRLLDSIVVVWDNQDNATALVPLTTLEGNSTTVIPVHVIHPERMSLSNRFLPYKEIKTTCVINLHEDMNIYPEDLTRG